MRGAPSKVLKALQEGFKITHKGLLVTAPIPGPADVPLVRLLMYALEATFAFAFWMMSNHKYLLYHDCCRWALGTFTYEGLCSHSALRDPINGNFGYSAEQLIKLADDAAKNRASRRRAYDAAYRAAHPEAIRETHARSEAYIWTLATYSCKLCGVRCKSNWERERHDDSRRHKINPHKQRLGVNKPYWCGPCGYETSVKDSLRRHKEGDYHRRRVVRVKGLPYLN
ncbi:hypothetical protein SLS61_000328 [Didymella pomorum]|jgi:hypothetical protein